MSRLKLTERLRLTHLAADKFRRSALSSVLSSPAFRWQFGTSRAEHLLIVPQDLRTADPSFWDELEIGELGLAGAVAVIGDYSPFDVEPPNGGWERELHGFAWLRHLDAVGRPEAREMSRLLALEWAMRNSSAGPGVAWQPDILARRLISWISHSSMLLEGADVEEYELLTESLGRQLVRLNASWRNCPGGYPRLLSLTGLLLSLISISSHDSQLAEAEKTFVSELSAQMLPDGGHISRNPAILIELILDLLPLHQCFAARGRPAPREFTEMVQRAIDMLKFMRMGDGMLARFNGVTVPSPAGLATVLAYDNKPGTMMKEARASGYVRAECGPALLIMDVSSPPPLDAAGEAHAGCLSFELSSGTSLVLVNGGAPASLHTEWRAAARATASHNTLVLGEASSARLIRHKALEDIIGSSPIRYPDNVSVKVEDTEAGITITANHDGYAERFSLDHHRVLTLSKDGTRLSGTDSLKGRGIVRLKQDIRSRSIFICILR